MAAIEFRSQQFHEAISGSKPVLVDYWAPWCSYCRRIGPAYEKIAEAFGEEVVIAKLNIDEEPLIANQERIEVIPTLVVYKEGFEMGSIVAPESKARIEEFLAEAL